MNQRQSYITKILVAVLLAALLFLAACAGIQRPTPSEYLSLPLVAPTATPARAQLEILQITQLPSITVDLFSVFPVGETFIVVTMTLVNTGETAIHPALLDIMLEDALERNFPRAQEAEFILRTANRPVFPDRQIPPGTQVQSLLVFDVTGVQLPVRLIAHLPEQTLYSAKFHGE